MRLIKGTMMDTETLALGPRALIWEVACVPFEMQIHEDHVSWKTSQNPYHCMVDYKDMSTRDFDIDMGTINWTSRQRASDPAWAYWRERHFNPGANLKAMDNPGMTTMAPRDILFNLKWMTKDAPVWFRNSAFDVPAFETLAKATGAEMPWHRRQQSDLYTQVNMANQMHGYEDNLPTSAGHRALEDAMGQIDQLAELCRLLYCPMAGPDHRNEEAPNF